MSNDKIKITGHYWRAIPDALIFDTEISSNAMRLYAVLRKYASLSESKDNEGGAAYPGQKRLANDLDCSKRSIINWMQELEQSGWISVERAVSSVGTNLYLIHNSPVKEDSPAQVNEVSPGVVKEDSLGVVNEGSPKLRQSEVKTKSNTNKENKNKSNSNKTIENIEKELDIEIDRELSFDRGTFNYLFDILVDDSLVTPGDKNFFKRKAVRLFLNSSNSDMSVIDKFISAFGSIADYSKLSISLKTEGTEVGSPQGKKVRK